MQYMMCLAKENTKPSEVRTMSEEQKKQVEGVLREMKHMNQQQIEVMIAYMQGVATAAKLMSEKKEA